MKASEEKTWGVKCLTEMGWYGGKRPKRFTKGEALQFAADMNKDKTDLDTWEARKLPT